MLAARVIVAMENPADIVVMSARPYGQRAVFKFAQYTGAKSIAGRHTPGTFTNQIQTYFDEPRLLVLTDPRTDHQVRRSPAQPPSLSSTRGSGRFSQQLLGSASCVHLISFVASICCARRRRGSFANVKTAEHALHRFSSNSRSASPRT